MSNSPARWRRAVGWVERALRARPNIARPARGCWVFASLDPTYDFFAPSFSATSSPSLSFLRRLAPNTFVFHPARGLVSATGATDACEAPGIACHDRHAGALFRRLAFPLKRKRSPCGAPPWRFCGPCPCSPLSGIPCEVERQYCSPPGSYCPQDRVSWTSTRYGVYAGRGRHLPRSA